MTGKLASTESPLNSQTVTIISKYLLTKIENREYHATFLPEVAKEQGWTKEETLKHLIRKAGEIINTRFLIQFVGYTGKLQDVEKKIQLERYQSSKCEITYKDYCSMRAITE